MIEYKYRCKEHGWEGHEKCPFCLGEQIAKVQWEYDQGFDAPEYQDSDQPEQEGQ